MASKGKERENFFRINVLVVDNIKNALVDMFKYYLLQKKMSFEEFIDQHMNDIEYLRETRNLYKEEFDKLIGGDKAISDITEVTVVRRLLVNLCPDLFMDEGCKTLQDFLKKNQHDIYHLFKINKRCCLCSQDYKFPVTRQLLPEDLLQEDEYKKMFKLSPCTNCAGASETVCSVSSCIATEYIRFDYKIKCKIFGHFSPIFEAMQKLTDLRNEAYGHVHAALLPKERYVVYKQDIEENIMVLARICGNEDDTRLALNDVQKRALDETLCIQYQNQLIEQIQRDRELMEEIGKNRQILQGNSQILQENSHIQQENSQILQENNQMLQKNSQILQEIPQQLQKITEEIENLKVTKTNLTKAQQSVQVEPVSGTSGEGPTTFQQDQSAKKKPIKSNNENEGGVSTIPQESDKSDNPVPVHTINKGMTNYARIGLVVFAIFPNILREIMCSKIAPDVLNRQIRKQHKNDPSLFNKVTHAERLSLNTLTNRTYDNIDFITLHKLIGSLSILDDPTQGWGRQPTNADVTISDDVERLRIVRNKIVHRITVDVGLIEMNELFSNIVNIIQRIDTYLSKPPDHGFATKVRNLQTNCMDSEIELSYHQVLKENIKENF